MDFIPTTATAVEKLSRLARIRRKSIPTSQAVALNVIAVENGYHHWKHVTTCAEQTASNKLRTKPLPVGLLHFLDSAAGRDPASTESQRAFTRGLAFAMDVKDAESMRTSADCIEADDAWHIAAREIWRTLVHHQEAETDSTLFEIQSPEELKSTVLDDLGNYRYFRYAGTEVPASLEESYKWINHFSFFPAAYIWLHGKFIDLSEIPEIRVDGKVVFSTTPGRPLQAPKDTRTRFEKFGHLLNEQEQLLFKNMDQTQQDFLLFQKEKQTSLGKTRYKSVEASTTASWKSAKKP